jgi:hypothetical protein
VIFNRAISNVRPPGHHALSLCGCKLGPDDLNHFLYREAMSEHDRFGAAIAAEEVSNSSSRRRVGFVRGYEAPRLRLR